MSNRMPPARPRTPRAGVPLNGSGGPSSRRSAPARPDAAAPAAESTQETNPTAKLVCNAGPRSGAEFPLTGGEVVVGRATDATVSIPDTSVSRRHMMIKRDGTGWLVSDLGSGNGTIVNGEPIAGELALRNGDVITLGDTEFTFIDLESETGVRSIPVLSEESPSTLVGAVPSVRRARSTSLSRMRRQRGPDPEASKRRKRLLLGAAGAFVALTLVGVGLKLREARQEAAVLAKQRAEQERRGQLAALFQEGKNLVRQGNWSQAKVKFEQVAEVDPGFQTLQDYLDRAKTEIPNQEHLASARALLEKNELGKAFLALGKVSQDTQQYEDLRALRLNLEERIGARLKEARALLDNGGDKDLAKMQQMEAITADILVASAENRDAVELNNQAKLNIDEINKPEIVRPPPGRKPWLDVQARFRDGDLAGALSLAQSCSRRGSPCVAQVGLLKTFEERFKKLESLSVKELDALMGLDNRLSGSGQSKYFRLIGARLIGHYLKAALAAKAADDWGRAIENANRVLRIEPAHAGAQAIKFEATSKAKDVYLRAYQLRETSPEEAVKLFKQCMGMVPKSDELYAKSQNWLNKIQQ